MSRYAAIVLAAGRGQRFRAAGGREPTKLVASHRGAPLVRHVVCSVLQSLAEPAIVVTGHARRSVEAALAGLDVRLAHNARSAEGLSTSLRCGLAAVPEDADGVVILLADMPEVAPDTIDALIRRAEQPPQPDAVVPTHAGRPGNPVLFRRCLFGRLDELDGDRGARRMLDDPALTIARIEQPSYVLADVDVPDDLTTAETRSGRQGAAGSGSQDLP